MAPHGHPVTLWKEYNYSLFEIQKLKRSARNEDNDAAYKLGMYYYLVPAEKVSFLQALTINEGLLDSTISFSNSKSEIMNLCGDVGKILYEHRLDLSGYTKAGKKNAGQWISRGLTQEELKKLHNKYGTEKQSVFYTEKEIQSVANKPLPRKKWRWFWQKKD